MLSLVLLATACLAGAQEFDFFRFNNLMLQADTCIAQRNFDCAADQLAEATQVVPKGPSTHRERLQDAKRRLSAARQEAVREENRKAREAKQAERDAERKAKAEQEKAERQREREAKAKEREAQLAAEKERKAKEREEKLAAEREQKAKEREAKERERVAKAEAARKKADDERRKKEEAEREKREKQEYLTALEQRTVMRARKCPDGEGKYYTVGRKPSIKPEKVSCIDVHFEARCPGSARGTTGVSKNFIGISTDCFMGDTVAIEPKPACPVDQVSVRVTRVTPCR